MVNFLIYTPLRKWWDARQKRFFAAVVGVILLALSGCSKDGEESVEPSPLPKFEQEVSIKKLWGRSVGDGQGEAWLHLVPAVEGKRIYIASAAGKITALDRVSGKKIWQVNLERNISGGTGSGQGLVLVATHDGYVVGLDADNGKKLWESPLSSESLSAPQVADGVVVVQTISSKLIGLNASNGEQLWIQETQQPVLTLRGTSTPLLARGAVFAGFANGEARAFRLDSGKLLWGTEVAVPRGTSELERIVDIDAAPLLSDDLLYMVSYQGNVVALDPSRGDLLWTREASSYESMAEGFGNLYLSNQDSVLSGVDQRTGTVVWSQKELLNRGLSGPVSAGSYVLTGDFEGYLHVLSQVDGRIVGRTKVDSSGIRAVPVVVNDIIYVYANNGYLAALTVQGK